MPALVLVFVLLTIGWGCKVAAAASLPRGENPSQTAVESIALKDGLLGRWLHDSRELPHGKIEGNVQWESTPNGPAAVFDGNSSLQIGQINADLLRHTFTVAVWFKPQTVSGSILGAWEYPRDRSFALVVDKKRRLQFVVSADGSASNSSRLIGKKKVFLGEWQFVAAIFDKGRLTLYQDDVSVSRQVKAKQTHSGQNTIQIGSLGLKGPFNGGVQDIYLYHRVLNETEVRLLAGRGTSFTVQHTLLFPKEKPKIHFQSARNLVGADLQVSLEKSRQVVWDKNIDNPPQQLSITVQPSTLPDDGYYNVSLTLQKQENILFQKTKPVFIRRAGHVKDILYFSFYTPRYGELELHHLRALKESPFTSMNASLMGAYETHALTKERFNKVVPLIRDCSKAVWPLIFINRMVGSSEHSRFDQRNAYWKKRNIADTPFSKIDLLDLYDKQGALTDFLANFQIALRLARETNAPGVFIDSEPYNCHQSRKIANLSLLNLKSGKQVVTRLKKIGADMADMVNDIYPEAALYFYSADFTITHKGCDYIERILFEAGLTDSAKCFQSYAYIVLGILQRAQERDYALKVIDGEVGQYTYNNMQHLKYKIGEVIRTIWPIKEKHGRHLFFAGRIAPFYEYENLSENSWIRTRLAPAAASEHLEIRSIEDFEKPYAFLLKAMDYVWIYGAGVAGRREGYNLFSESSRLRYNHILGKAIAGLNHQN